MQWPGEKYITVNHHSIGFCRYLSSFVITHNSQVQCTACKKESFFYCSTFVCFTLFGSDSSFSRSRPILFVYIACNDALNIKVKHFSTNQNTDIKGNRSSFSQSGNNKGIYYVHLHYSPSTQYCFWIDTIIFMMM